MLKCPVCKQMFDSTVLYNHMQKAHDPPISRGSAAQGDKLIVQVSEGHFAHSTYFRMQLGNEKVYIHAAERDSSVVITSVKYYHKHKEVQITDWTLLGEFEVEL